MRGLQIRVVGKGFFKIVRACLENMAERGDSYRIPDRAARKLQNTRSPDRHGCHICRGALHDIARRKAPARLFWLTSKQVKHHHRSIAKYHEFRKSWFYDAVISTIHSFLKS